MRLLAAILLVLVHPTRVRTGLLNAGPYNLKMERVEAFGDLENIKNSTHKTFIQGSIYIPGDFDDSVTAHLHFSRFGSRGWGLNAYKLKMNAYCSTFATTYPTLLNFVFKSWGIEKPSCPIKAGNYTMDMDTDLPRLKFFPLLPYGRYRLEYTLVHGNPPVKFSCSVWYITCSERPC